MASPDYHPSPVGQRLSSLPHRERPERSLCPPRGSAAGTQGPRNTEALCATLSTAQFPARVGNSEGGVASTCASEMYQNLVLLILLIRYEPLFPEFSQEPPFLLRVEKLLL